jgi:hypothetical protein
MRILFSVFFISIFSISFAQIVPRGVRDSIRNAKDSIHFSKANDTIFINTIELEEVVVSTKYEDKEAERRKNFLILQRRVLKVYPYAKDAADHLVMLNTNMSKLKTEKEKKKYFKIVENYLEKEFEAQLKKLTRKEGQILIKLIHRQTGTSTYNLIKDVKSGWKAYWSSKMAKMFDLDLKKEYNPYEISEDYLIEGILLKAFRLGTLPKQEAKVRIDYGELLKIWAEKLENSKKD